MIQDVSVASALSSVEAEIDSCERELRARDDALRKQWADRIDAARQRVQQASAELSRLEAETDATAGAAHTDLNTAVKLEAQPAGRAIWHQLVAGQVLMLSVFLVITSTAWVDMPKTLLALSIGGSLGWLLGRRHAARRP